MSRLIRWNPARPTGIEYALDRFLDEPWRSFFTDDTARNYSLALDLDEHDNGYILKTDLPGVDPDKIDIRMEDDLLTIEAEVNEETEKKEGRSLVRERRIGKFSRTVRLPHMVDANAIEASYENGVLQLTLPKLPEVQPKQISVKVGNGNNKK